MNIQTTSIYLSGKLGCIVMICWYDVSSCSSSHQLQKCHWKSLKANGIWGVSQQQRNQAYMVLWNLNTNSGLHDLVEKHPPQKWLARKKCRYILLPLFILKDEIYYEPCMGWLSVKHIIKSYNKLNISNEKNLTILVWIRAQNSILYPFMATSQC